MILVAGIPRDWEGIQTIILSNASNTTTAVATTGQLVFNTVVDQVVAEYERRYQGFHPQDQPSGSNITSLLNRITAVNRQSSNAPKFQKQFNQPRQEQGGDQSQSQRKRQGGKAVKQRRLDAKAKAEEKGKGPEIAPQHSHSFSYFASAANQHSLCGVGHSVQLGSHLLAIPLPPPSLPIPLSQNKALSRKSSRMFEKVTIATNTSVKDVCKHAEPQQFTGSKPGNDSYYPTVNIARALASNLEVVKTTETMKKLELDVNAMDLDPPRPASCPPIALLPSCSYADDADYWDKSDNGSDFDPSEGNVANFGTFYAPERDQTLRFERSPSLPASRAPTPEAAILPGYEHYNHPPVVGDYVPFGGRVNDMPENWRPFKDLTDSEKKKKIDAWDAEQVDYSVDEVEWNTNNAMGFDQGRVTSFLSSQDTDLINNATALPFIGICSVVYMAPFVMSDARNKISLHADCPVCNKKEDGVDEPYKWIMDSGASRHFTHDLNDFAEYETEGNFSYVQTAAAHTRLDVKAKGTVKIQVWIDGTWRSNKTPRRYEIFELKEVLYVPGLHQRLLSLGALLQQGLSIFGEDDDLVFYKDSKAVLVASKDLHLSDTIYFVQSF